MVPCNHAIMPNVETPAYRKGRPGRPWTSLVSDCKKRWTVNCPWEKKEKEGKRKKKRKGKKKRKKKERKGGKGKNFNLIPTSSCSAERSFSALRRIKTYLRDTIGDERLSAVAILSIERETTNFIEASRMEEIMNQFAEQKEARKPLLFHDS